MTTSRRKVRGVYRVDPNRLRRRGTQVNLLQIDLDLLDEMSSNGRVQATWDCLYRFNTRGHSEYWVPEGYTQEDALSLLIASSVETKKGKKRKIETTLPTVIRIRYPCKKGTRGTVLEIFNLAYEVREEYGLQYAADAIRLSIRWWGIKNAFIDMDDIYDLVVV